MNINFHSIRKDGSIYCGVVGAVTIGHAWTDSRRQGIHNTCTLCEGEQATMNPNAAEETNTGNDGNVWSQ